jgi:hypothetical protein
VFTDRLLLISLEVVARLAPMGERYIHLVDFLNFTMKGCKAAVKANIAGGVTNHINLLAKRICGINPNVIYEWKLYSKTPENERNTIVLMYFQTDTLSNPIKYLGYDNL